VFGARNIDTLFFTIQWDQYGFDKKCIGTSYVNIVFLHPVGSVAHVVHSGVFGQRNVDVLFLMLDQYELYKKRASTHYAKLVFLHPLGSVGHTVHSGASRLRNVDALFFMLGWDNVDSKKLCRDMLRLTCVCASSGIYRLRSAF
jgi:hypothetical protein